MLVDKILNKMLKWKGVPTNHELLEHLPEGTIDNFTSDARMFKASEYHQWRLQDLELMAERWMFKGDKESLLIGKGILYCLEILVKNETAMASGKVKTDAPLKKKMRRFR